MKWQIMRVFGFKLIAAYPCHETKYGVDIPLTQLVYRNRIGIKINVYILGHVWDINPITWCEEHGHTQKPDQGKVE
jgi:hypothetical protein